MSASTHPHLSSPTPTSSSRDSISDIYGPRTPYPPHSSWPTRIDHHLSATPTHYVQSACTMCSNGCACDIAVKDGRVVGVRGRGQDRVNKGRLGPKGLHSSWTSIHSPDRLTRPLLRKGGVLTPVSWDEAMTVLVERTRDVQRRLTSHGLGIYTTGQLFLEEYHALAMIGKAGLHSLHMDGNTRLCTATAATAMRESFGSDGQPGSYTDIDHTACIMLVGHNVANTQTVLWARMLDRLAGPSPPTLIVIDPRLTTSAQRATVHLAPRAGTNVALLNGLQRLLLPHANVPFLDAHCVGMSDLRAVLDRYTPEYVEQVTGVPPRLLAAAAQLIIDAPSLLSTVLQGVYQSHQATAAACQVNNIHLILGRIGQPGSGVLQMNGQPTAQNNREAGANGEYPGFRNAANEVHMRELATCWGVKLSEMAYWGESPTHIMEMLNMLEAGSMQLLWVIGTNPLVSLPELERVRRLLTKPSIFVVVQDIFMTESAQVADLVLPAAMWGEKTGCFTNVDRTVHISYKAVDPPGEAKSDFDIFRDYAARMGFTGEEGRPLLPFNTPEEAFEHWKRCSVGRPCDYSGMSYAKLTGGSGVQWPCNAEHPDGQERLFSDGRFFTDVDYCESYGHDLETGTPYTRDEYMVVNPAGRAILKAAHYLPSEDAPSDEYPLRLMTGRDVYHFHTRTKTGRDAALAKAGGDVYVQVAQADADKYGVAEGDWARVSSVRGEVEARVRVGKIDAGQVFLPFHFGYWDAQDGRARAANELTPSVWDAVSKQPQLKGGVVRLDKVEEKEAPAGGEGRGGGEGKDEGEGEGGGGRVRIHRRARTGQEVKEEGKEEVQELQTAAIHRAQHKGEGRGTAAAEDEARHQHVVDAVLAVVVGCEQLMAVYDRLREEHAGEVEVRMGLRVLAGLARQVKELMEPFVGKYAGGVGGEGGEEEEKEAEEEVRRRRGWEEERGRALVAAVLPEEGRLRKAGVSPSYALLRDLQAVWTLTSALAVVLTGLVPTAAALKDADMAAAVKTAQHHLHRQTAWAEAKVKVKAPQTLIVPVQVQAE